MTIEWLIAFTLARLSTKTIACWNIARPFSLFPVMMHLDQPCIVLETGEVPTKAIAAREERSSGDAQGTQDIARGLFQPFWYVKDQ